MVYRAWNKGLTKETDERLRKCSESSAKSRKGLAHSEEHKERIGLSMQGDNNPAKKLEVRNKMSKSHFGDKNIQWKGGVKMTYHTRARKIMEEHLGRKLSTTEIVHHVDNNHQNNSIENLYIFNSTGEHNNHHSFLRSLIRKIVMFNRIKSELGLR